MTAVATNTTKMLDLAGKRQAWITGAILIGLGVLIAFFMAPDTQGAATFRLSRPTDALQVPNLVVSGQPFIYFTLIVLTFLGARQFLRGGAQ